MFENMPSEEAFRRQFGEGPMDFGGKDFPMPSDFGGNGGPGSRSGGSGMRGDFGGPSRGGDLGVDKPSGSKDPGKQVWTLCCTSYYQSTLSI